MDFLFASLDIFTVWRII